MSAPSLPALRRRHALRTRYGCCAASTAGCMCSASAPSSGALALAAPQLRSAVPSKCHPGRAWLGLAARCSIKAGRQARFCHRHPVSPCPEAVLCFGRRLFAAPSPSLHAALLLPYPLSTLSPSPLRCCVRLVFCIDSAVRPTRTADHTTLLGPRLRSQTTRLSPRFRFRPLAPYLRGSSSVLSAPRPAQRPRCIADRPSCRTAPRRRLPPRTTTAPTRPPVPLCRGNTP
jgi:hypothetical protein